jgi:hypothetical protein
MAEKIMSDKLMTRLYESMQWSRKKLNFARQEYADAVHEYVGSHYSEDAKENKKPVNLLELAVSIYMQKLIGGCPQVVATTRYNAFKVPAYNLELLLNDYVRQIKLHETFQMGVIQSLFTPKAVFKVYLKENTTEKIDGEDIPIMSPMVATVSLDDWVQDMAAKQTIFNSQYMGDRWYANKEKLLEKVNQKDAKEKIEKMASIETDGQGRADEVGSGQEASTSRFKEMVAVWDVFLPDEGIVLQMLDENSAGQRGVINVIELDSPNPDTGMYRFLSYNSVPDNLLGLPPVSTWRDLNNIANGLYRKLEGQARRQKSGVGVRRGAEKDGEKIVKFKDGEVFVMDDPRNALPVNIGGADQGNFAFFLQNKDLFDYMAGNLTTLGALGPQADTLGQETLLNAGASDRVKRMFQKVQNTATEIFYDLGSYLYNDPYQSYPVTKTVPGFTDVMTTIWWAPADREPTFDKFDIKIEPYSLQYKGPQERLNLLDRVFERFFGPYAQQMAAQGVGVDFFALKKYLAKYADLPELDEIIVNSNMEPVEGAFNRPRQRPNTTRTNVRVNRPGATRQGKDEALSQILLGSKGQQSQNASITRPTG